jgi:cell division transport system permease protein
MIESKLKTFDDISRVTYQRDMVNMVNENINKISLLLLGLAIVLLIVSMALINNTVRLSIYANRFLINTMKLVGATSWFVRKPYILKGVVNGLLASFLALIMLTVMVFYILRSFGMTIFVIQPLTALSVSAIVIVSGIILTALSSYSAVGKYLRMDRNDMYFV